MRTKPTDRRGKRANRPDTLGRTLDRVTKPIFGKRGLADGAVVKDWPVIVGDSLARHSQPEKISYTGGDRTDGTLHLRVDHSALATELQHLEPVLLEKVNAYFGYHAVARLKLIHAPLPAPEGRPEKVTRPLDDTEERTLKDGLGGVTDPELLDALDRLGRAVIGRTRKDDS